MLAWGAPQESKLACDPALKARFNQVDYSFNVVPASESRFQPRKLSGLPQAAAESCAFGAQHGQSRLSSLEFAQVVGYVWISRRQRFDVADFDVDFLYAGPFGARTEKPPSSSDDARGVESIARD